MTSSLGRTRVNGNEPVMGVGRSIRAIAVQSVFGGKESDMKNAIVAMSGLMIGGLVLATVCAFGQAPTATRGEGPESGKASGQGEQDAVSRTSPTERKTSVSLSQMPDVIKKAIQDSFPEGEVIGIEKEVEGKDVGQYDVDVLSAGKQYEVEISSEGEVIETKEVPLQEGGPESSWLDEFDLAKRTLLATGRNRYFILEPGFQIVLEGEDAKVAITVLDETVDVNGIETRVVEEREWENGELVEVSRNFFVICKDTKDVFYFGEDVDKHDDGKVTSASDAWRAGKGNAKPGLIMPGTPVVGQKYYQEIAPKVAMDRAEIVSLTESLKTPRGDFVNCLKALETSALKPSERGFKTYAPDIGMIQDEDLLLVKYGFLEKE